MVTVMFVVKAVFVVDVPAPAVALVAAVLPPANAPFAAFFRRPERNWFETAVTAGNEVE
jgi:hypothetical protein